MRRTHTIRRQRRSRNRTRTLFYIFIAIMLGLIALSLSAQIIDSAILLQIYIAASVLAVGVIAIDLLGFFGAHHGDDGATTDDSGGGDSDDGSVDDGGDVGHSFDDAIDAHDAGDDFGSEDAGHDDLYDDADHLDQGDEVPLHDVEHDSLTSGRGPVLEAIRYLRMFVYFCLGFGLVGVALLATGRTPQVSLVFSGLAGLGTVLMARTFYRLQPRDTGTVMSDEDLLWEEGTVIVPLDREVMGKVRVQLGMQVYEPYALAAKDGASFSRGDAVKIVRVTDECVYVEQA